ncbi:glycosyltransferase [Pseudophaeobacter sp.]|uniref:glycosyltransferase n=1 Tax=Pseudophaeobacter sp. TaxID=1971739 RepID=UPI004058CDDA
MKFWTSPPLATPLPRPAGDSLQRASVQAFGQQVEIWHREEALEVQQRRQDLGEIYELFLASRVLPLLGLCVDIGAGAGWFGLAFAAAFPRWQVLCIEADCARYQALQETVQRSGLENISCLQGGFHPEATASDIPIYQSLKMENHAFERSEILSAILSEFLAQPQWGDFCALPGLGGRLAPATAVSGDGAVQSCPALPPGLLTALAPDLVKLDAPGVETELAQAMHATSTAFVTGRLVSHVPSAALLPQDPEVKRQIYLPHGDLALRRDHEDSLGARRPGLDVVVAMYNARDFIGACLDSLLADDNPDIRVLVVDDGSTDGSGDLVAERYRDCPRLQLLPKANGGCASARNHGRACSDASHIAFVDADDRVDPGLFSSLLELARYGGFNMVEGEFFAFEVDATGAEQRHPQAEQARFSEGPLQRLGEIRYALSPSLDLMQGQPSIWRRIYRRDFLDHWQIGFPEHVRAFDDQIFQLLCAQHGGEMAHVFGQSYHYRQHPAQDIKQGDARHFYSFNMFREVFLRAEAEAWPDLQPVMGALINTLRWSHAGLPAELQQIYREAAVGFLAMLVKAFGPGVLSTAKLERSGIEGLAFLVQRRLNQMANLPQGCGMLHMEDWRWQPEFIEMMGAMR